MCGIFALVRDQFADVSYFHKLSHRGPDQTIWRRDLLMGFHRLAIMGLHCGEQPLELEGLYLICNGEIYNYSSFDFPYATESDCESILHLYLKLGAPDCFRYLDGVFALVIRDTQNQEWIVARDRYGVRPLFMALDSEGKIMGWASEAKALGGFARVEPFLPGFYLILDSEGYFQYKRWSLEIPFCIGSDLTSELRTRLEGSVQKRLQSQRPLGVLLSGGLDSSLIASLTVQLKGETPVDTFSIGLPNSPDLLKARAVAQYLGTRHHEVIMNLSEGLEVIPEVIYHLETYDVTTIRASIPMYLLSKWIRSNTEVKVILSGEAPDELLGGYLYFHYAPNLEEFQKETLRRVRQLYLYDVLRSDRSTAAWGLEVRVPYLDPEVAEWCLNLDPQWKDPKKTGIEKYILRQAGQGLLPDELLWRPKEAFSDGVGYGWKDALKAWAESQYDPDNLKKAQETYPINPPPTAEALIYRKIFETFYPQRADWIPEIWMPRWVDEQLDPSATVLQIHRQRIKS